MAEKNNGYAVGKNEHIVGKEAKVVFRTVEECLVGNIDDVNIKGGFHLKGWVIAPEEPKETKKGGSYYTRFSLLGKEGQMIKATLWRKNGTYLNEKDEIELQRCTLNEYQDERGILGFFFSILPNEGKLPAIKKKVVVSNRENYWEAKFSFDVENSKEIRKMHIHNLKKDCFTIASTEINTQIDAGWFEINEKNKEESRVSINARAKEIFQEVMGEEKEDENG